MDVMHHVMTPKKLYRISNVVCKKIKAIIDNYYRLRYYRINESSILIVLQEKVLLTSA